jgi:K+-transporting ATPase c subunit
MSTTTAGIPRCRTSGPPQSAYARLQAARVARVRGLPEEQVLDLISEHTSGRALGFLGEPSVNVLELNLALDGLGGR